MAGLLSDRFGRKKMLVVAAVLFLVSALGTALPRDSWPICRLSHHRRAGHRRRLDHLADVHRRDRPRPASAAAWSRSTSSPSSSGMLVVYFVNYFIADVRARGPAGQRLPRRWRHPGGTAGGGPGGPARAGLERRAWLAVDVRLGRPARRWSSSSCCSWCRRSPRWLTKQPPRRGPGHLDPLTAAGPRPAEIWPTSKRPSPTKAAAWRQLLEPWMRRVLVIGIVLAVLQQVTGINVFLYFAPEDLSRSSGSGQRRRPVADGHRRRRQPDLHRPGHLDGRPPGPKAADDRRRRRHGPRPDRHGPGRLLADCSSGGPWSSSSATSPVSPCPWGRSPG